MSHADPPPPARRGTGRFSKGVWALLALIGTTVLTAAVSWVVTTVADRTKDRLEAGEPVVVTVESDPTRVSGFGDEVRAVAVPAGQVPAPDPGAGCRDLYTWARARSGVDAGRSLLHLFVRGERAGEVVIHEIRAVVDRRQAPAPALELSCHPDGELEDRRLGIDLDSGSPVARYDSAEGNPFGFTVRRGEVEAFLITATVNSSAVWWHLEIDVVDGDQRRTVRVDDNGRPFATVPAATGGRWRWGSDGWSAVDLGPGAVGPTAVRPGDPLPPLPTP
jgi:hypothetical protein